MIQGPQLPTSMWLFNVVWQLNPLRNVFEIMKDHLWPTGKGRNLGPIGGRGGRGGGGGRGEVRWGLLEDDEIIMLYHGHASTATDDI